MIVTPIPIKNSGDERYIAQAKGILLPSHLRTSKTNPCINIRVNNWYEYTIGITGAKDSDIRLMQYSQKIHKKFQVSICLQKTRADGATAISLVIIQIVADS